MQPEQALVVAYCIEMNVMTEAKARDRDSVKIMPGIIPCVGRTNAEAA